MYNILKENFAKTSSAYTLYPFWLLNDELDEGELLRQIDDFKAHGIDGFIPHPRMGMPRSIPYMSEKYLDYIELCVARAKELGMTVILYDEASYPSGSACGQVVEAEPSYAARCLRMADKADVSLSEGEYVVAEVGDRVFVEGFTGGTIRGLHPGQDDGQPDAPRAADLLNPAATELFIELTHEKYFKRLGKYFGETVIGFFTDEPSLTGRGGDMKGKISWTAEFLYDFVEAGGTVEGLPELFKPDGDNAMKQAYHKAIRRRLAECFYKPLSDWCADHAVSLTGHPHSSGETDVQKYMQIPGQDLVWRWVAPENDLTSPHSVVGKCSADSARHLGAIRNMDEVLGVCGAPGNPWDFTLSDMLWYWQFLFARGVNMLVLHAFYYSLRTKTQFGERPPDVGPNNIWWPYYDRFAAYAKRMSWLNTGSANKPYAAVLCDGENMPYLEVAGLFERRIDFNYVDMGVFAEKGHLHGGKYEIDRYSYDIILVAEGTALSPEAEARLAKFEAAGGSVCRGGDFAEFVAANAVITERFEPESGEYRDLRLVRLNKCGVPYILLVNEGPTAVSGTLVTELKGACELFDPFTGGSSKAVITSVTENGTRIAVTVAPRVPTILAFDKTSEPEISKPVKYRVSERLPIENGRVSVTRTEDARYFVAADEVRDQCRVVLNGSAAGELLFIPWELEVTGLIEDGGNTVTFEVDGSMANKYGKPVQVGVYGAALEVRVRA